MCDYENFTSIRYRFDYLKYRIFSMSVSINRKWVINRNNRRFWPESGTFRWKTLTFWETFWFFAKIDDFRLIVTRALHGPIFVTGTRPRPWASARARPARGLKFFFVRGPRAPVPPCPWPDRPVKKLSEARPARKKLARSPSVPVSARAI